MKKETQNRIKNPCGAESAFNIGFSAYSHNGIKKIIYFL